MEEERFVDAVGIVLRVDRRHLRTNTLPPHAQLVQQFACFLWERIHEVYRLTNVIFNIVQFRGSSVEVLNQTIRSLSYDTMRGCSTVVVVWIVPEQ